MFRQKGSVHVM